MKKTCSVCHEEKPLDAFYNSKTGLHGVTSRCKACATRNTYRPPARMKSTGSYSEYIKKAGKVGNETCEDYCKRTAKYW